MPLWAKAHPDRSIAKPMKPFNEDDIKRTGLPADVFGLLHDLSYHINGNLRGTLDNAAFENYVTRAQIILKNKPKPNFQCGALKQGTTGGNYPADCNWPFCGCDEQAGKVIDSLLEQGWNPPESRSKA
jgi:hypothetical protein